MKHWVDQRVALLTQHGKERVIAPVLEPGLGCVVHHVDHFDRPVGHLHPRHTPTRITTGSSP